MADLRDVTILVPGGIHPRVLQRLAETFTLVRTDAINPGQITDQMKQVVRGAAVSPALGAGKVDAAFFAALPQLEIVANFGVGYDSVDARYAGEHGVMVTNTPDVLTDEVADFTVGLLIDTVREMAKAEAYLRAGRWSSEGNYPLSKASLRGRRIGLFGLGRIGAAIAVRLAAFGLPIAYHTRSKVDGVPYAYHGSLLELAQSVDTLISSAPGGASTAKAVNAEVLKALGPDGVFINIGRGSTVDEDALVQALLDRVILAAGLDVYANEPHVRADLMALPNATLLPHIASGSIRTRDAMADLVVDNLIAWFSTGRPLTPVPEAKPSR